MTHDPCRGCAEKIMGTLPLIMRSIVPEMHKRERECEEFSVSQFRTLMIISHHKGASLSFLAEHLGLSLSLASKVVENLVEREYISREKAGNDRRRVLLALTDRGTDALKTAEQGALEVMKQRLAVLSGSELEAVSQTMEILQLAFTPGRITQPDSTEEQRDR